MLTHGNVVAAVSAVLVQLSHYRPNVGDVMISYLPLAHMLERCCEVGSVLYIITIIIKYNVYIYLEWHVSGRRFSGFLLREH